MRNNNQKRKLTLMLVVGALALSGLSCSMGELLGTGERPLEVVGSGGIAGRIWHDLCANPPQGSPLPDDFPPGCVFDQAANGLVANHLLDADERGIENIELEVARGACPGEFHATTRSAPDGMFLFAGLEAATYCVTIDPGSAGNENLLLPGRWTYPSISDSSGPMSVSISLAEGEVRADTYFAWDFQLTPVFQAPEVLTPTPDLTPSPQPTATATSEPSSTPQPTGSPMPTPTPTFSSSDPRAILGLPTWEDNLENDGDWFLYADEHVSFEMVEGQMELKAYNPDFYSGWSLGWRKDSNMFVEATLKMLTCSGRDAVGLVFRAPDVGKGYLFGVSCEGRYSLRLWDGISMTRIQDWTSHSALLPGSDQAQRLAVWTNGNVIRLYANGTLLKELVDATYTEEGLFGVFISSASTPNFQARLTEFLYWNAP